jgi:hypothetical protein
MIAKAEFTRANMLAFLAKVIRTESWILPRGESFAVDQPAIPNSVPAEWATARLFASRKSCFNLLSGVNRSIKGLS